ncbi:allophanate hydrolase-related protein [Roseomonas populi]|uniref:Allophanate hydrolase C-terminal domain-containing protein n=1 Tax=Roseomonas populi TaxID=3121582 RepID=A0ABT1X4T1_9PROT|nr:hypothetical protein [Roseomonas pecuniae]MCR0983110.1 hypothetical protein [Roseomonas pecuniae]
MSSVESMPLLLAVGNHLQGLSRHFELADRGARLVGTAWTEPSYRLLARGTETPLKPGLVEVARDGGTSIEGELYTLPGGALEELATLVRAPIQLGQVRLRDGRVVHGYLCDAAAIADARDVSHLGGWRAFLNDSAAE